MEKHRYTPTDMEEVRECPLPKISLMGYDYLFDRQCRHVQSNIDRSRERSKERSRERSREGGVNTDHEDVDVIGVVSVLKNFYF